ncbi:17016_t:CDS:10 [Funneliformis geosporum]|nr:17016_t:CDS:10 [Funneliformis geosporum]
MIKNHKKSTPTAEIREKEKKDKAQELLNEKLLKIDEAGVKIRDGIATFDDYRELNKEVSNNKELEAELKELRKVEEKLNSAEKLLAEKDEELAANKGRIRELEADQARQKDELKVAKDREKEANDNQELLEAEKVKFEDSQKKLEEKKRKEKDNAEKEELKRKLANEQDKVNDLNCKLEGLQEELRAFKKSNWEERYHKLSKKLGDEIEKVKNSYKEKRKVLEQQKKELQSELQVAQKTINLLDENEEKIKSNLTAAKKQNQDYDDFLKMLFKMLKGIQIREKENHLETPESPPTKKYQNRINKLSLYIEGLEEQIKNQEEKREEKNIFTELKQQELEFSQQATNEKNQELENIIKTKNERITLLEKQLDKADDNLELELTKKDEELEQVQNPLVLLAHQNQLDSTFSNPDLLDYPMCLTDKELENETLPGNEFVLPENGSASSQLDRSTKKVHELDRQEVKELKINQTALENNFKKYKEEYKFKATDITKEKEITDQISHLINEMSKYEKEQTEHNKTTDRLTKSNSENEARIKKLGSNVANLVLQIRDFEVREGKLQTDLHRLGAKNTELTDEISRLNTAGKKEQKNLKIFQTRVKNRGTKITELNSQITKLIKRPDITETRYNELLTIEANQLKDRNRLEIARLKVENKNYKQQRDSRPDISLTDYEKLSEKIKNQKDKIAELKTQLAEIQTEITSLKEQLKAKKTNSESQNQDYQGQISRLENEVLNTTKTKEQQAVKISELQQQIDDNKQWGKDYQDLATKLEQEQQSRTQSEKNHH